MPDTKNFPYNSVNPNPNPKNMKTMQTHKHIATKLVAAGAAILLTAGLVGAVFAADKSAAKGKSVELKLDGSLTVVLDAARNGLPAKTKLMATAPFAEYYLTPVVDGIKRRKDLSWQEAAWASEEEDSMHGIEVHLGQPQRGGRFQVTWAYDTNGDEKVRWWASRDYVIQVKEKAGDEWQTVADVKNNQSVVSSHPLPETAYSFVRIYQLAGGGHPSRPNLMWVGQIEVVD